MPDEKPTVSTEFNALLAEHRDACEMWGSTNNYDCLDRVDVAEAKLTAYVAKLEATLAEHRRIGCYPTPRSEGGMLTYTQSHGLIPPADA